MRSTGWMSRRHENFGEPLGAALVRDGVDDVVAALRTFALVDREMIVDERDASVTTDAIRPHQLVREVAALRENTAAGTTVYRKPSVALPPNSVLKTSSDPERRRIVAKAKKRSLSSQHQRTCGVRRKAPSNYRFEVRTKTPD
jgi:hypothetical protein